jgi:hypothetical protein
MHAQGDSGFIVIRRGTIVARSRPLQHYFDCPLQVRVQLGPGFLVRVLKP